jgi:hypothetical protein
VDPVGAGLGHQVRAIIEDEQRVVLGAHLREAPAEENQLVVGGPLVAQLDDVHAAAQRCMQPRGGPRVADQVQARSRQALAAIDHSPSLPGEPR